MGIAPAKTKHVVKRSELFCGKYVRRVNEKHFCFEIGGHFFKLVP